jgi:hypothetical protein
VFLICNQTERPFESEELPGKINWLRPSKRSARVSLQSGPSNTYSFSTLTHGSARRPELSASCARVRSFSLASNFFRAASHSVLDKTSHFLSCCLTS